MAVLQTHRVHCIQASGADQVKVADTSNEIDKYFRICRIRKTIITPPTQSATGEDSPLDNDIQPCQLPTNLTIGLWVIVKYATIQTLYSVVISCEISVLYLLLYKQ